MSALPDNKCDRPRPPAKSVCICVATTFCRRAGLTRLLRSLSSLSFQKNSDVLVRVAVADNDADGSAWLSVKEAAQYLQGIPITLRDRAE